MPEQDKTRQFLSFTLQGERYAFPVARVLEVLECGRITALPRQEAWLRGLIDLRGRSVPVLDLKRKFGLGETLIGEGSAIIVVEFLAEEGSRKVGLLADAVHEVIDLAEESIEAAPDFGSGPAVDFLTGLGRLGESFLLILDPDRIFEARELEAVRGA